MCRRLNKKVTQCLPTLMPQLLMIELQLIMIELQLIRIELQLIRLELTTKP